MSNTRSNKTTNDTSQAAANTQSENLSIEKNAADQELNSLQKVADMSSVVGQMKSYQHMADESISVHPSNKTIQKMDGLEDEELLQGKFNPIQMQSGLEEEELLQGKFDPIQKKGDGTPVAGGNQTGLPDHLKSGIENLSGYSMDDVNVHYNSDKPAQFQAHAYAQGSDIHLGAGQEKHLPHEAWHVVQQKQGRVKPTRQMKGRVNVNDDAGLEKEADLMGIKAMSIDTDVHTKKSTDEGKTSSGPLQMKQALVTSDLTLHKYTKTGEPYKKQAKALKKGEKKPVAKFSDIEVSDTETDHLKNAKGTITHYKLEAPNAGYFAAASNLIVSGFMTQDDATAKTELEQLKTEIQEGRTGIDPEMEESPDALEYGDFLTGVPGDVIGDISDDLTTKELNGMIVDKDSSELTAGEKQSAGDMAFASGAIGIGSGLLGLASGAKTLLDSDAEAYDKVEAVFSMIQSASDIGESASSIANQATESAASDSSGNFFSSFGSVVGSIISAMATIKEVVELVGMITADEKYDKQEFAVKGYQVVSSALEMAKSVVSSVGTIYNIVAGGIPVGVANAVPGLDIAMSGLKIIMEGFYLVQSAFYMHQMKKQQLTVKGKVKSEKGLTDAQFEEERQFFKSNESAEVNAKSYEKYNNDKLVALEAEKLEVDAKILTANSVTKVYYVKKKASIEKEIRERTAKKASNLQVQQDLSASKTGHAQSAPGGVSSEAFDEYNLVSELKNANKKRIIRQSIHISTDIASIAGTIASLTGAAAPVGASIKAAAAGIEMSLPFARAIKQYGRNKAAKNVAKGKAGTSKVNKVFNADKSSEVKVKERTKYAMKILSMAASAGGIKPPGQTPGEERAWKAKRANTLNTVELYIKSTGCPPAKLYRANGEPIEQIKILVEEMSKREFL